MLSISSRAYFFRLVTKARWPVSLFDPVELSAFVLRRQSKCLTLVNSLGALMTHRSSLRLTSISPLLASGNNVWRKDHKVFRSIYRLDMACDIPTGGRASGEIWVDGSILFSLALCLTFEGLKYVFNLASLYSAKENVCCVVAKGCIKSGRTRLFTYLALRGLSRQTCR